MAVEHIVSGTAPSPLPCLQWCERGTWIQRALNYIRAMSGKSALLLPSGIERRDWGRDRCGWVGLRKLCKGQEEPTVCGAGKCGTCLSADATATGRATQRQTWWVYMAGPRGHTKNCCLKTGLSPTGGQDEPHPVVILLQTWQDNPAQIWALTETIPQN